MRTAKSTGISIIYVTKVGEQASSVGKIGDRARRNCGMNGQTNKNALVGECVKNMKGSWRSARDLRTSHFDVHRDNAKRYDAVGYREKCIFTRPCPLPSCSLILCPLEQRIHERTRPLRPCHAVASSTCSQSTVNRCPTNRPTGCSFVRSRWRRMIDHLPANAFPFEIRGDDTRCCLVCCSGSPLSNAWKKSKDVSSRHQCTVERIDDYAVVVAC